MKGKLVVFEGIDGVGKTTQIKILKGKFPWVVCFSEPSNTKSGRDIKRRLENEDSGWHLEGCIQMDRKNQYEYGIKPNIEKGKLVLLDRSFFSSICYKKEKININDFYHHQPQWYFPRPDLVFIFDVPVKTAIKRISKRGETNPRESFERLNLARKNYLELFQILKSNNLNLINATRPIDIIENEIQDILKENFSLNFPFSEEKIFKKK